MKAILFATKKEAEKYIQVNHQGRDIENSSLYDESDWEGSDRVMENFQWSGETECYNILDKEGNSIDRVAWWEDGDDIYNVYRGDELLATFDNKPTALYFLQELWKKEEEKDDEEMMGVSLYCNDELIEAIIP